MSDIPKHILAQVHVLAADGLPIEQIAFMLRLDQRLIKKELRHPTVPVNTTNQQVPLHGNEASEEPSNNK